MVIHVGIFGATGYTGFELIRLLKQHPQVRICFATSEQYAGQRLNSVFPCFEDLSLTKADEVPLEAAEAVFCCLPHGTSMRTVARARAAGVRVVDLSADFRLANPDIYTRWYGIPHLAPQLLPEAVYGLPERHRAAIRGANLVANPGCYPTSVILALAPLAQAGALDPTRRIIVDAKSGISGAGRTPSLSTHFVEAHDNLSPYSIGYVHRHISEMERELNVLGGPYAFTFSPHLVPLNRGLLSTIYVDLMPGWDAARAQACLEEAYANEPFVHVLPPGKLATVRHVVGTNHCVISVTGVGNSAQAIVVSAIDNLLKGASGQAVQNLNVMYGWDETLGLTGYICQGPIPNLEANRRAESASWLADSARYALDD